MLEVILPFLSSWIANKALDRFSEKALDRFSRPEDSFRSISAKIDVLLKDPSKAGWSGPELSEDDRKLVSALGHVSQNYLDWAYAYIQPSTRPIAVIGASGAGKSHIAARFIGETPRSDITFDHDYEVQSSIANKKWIRVFVAPGDFKHGADGITKVSEQFVDKRSPFIVCNVVANGWLATVDEAYLNTYQRPRTAKKRVAKTLKEFVHHNREEEINYLTKFFESCEQRGLAQKQQTIPVTPTRVFLTIINKRDLWGKTERQTERVIRYYSSERSAYGKEMKIVRDSWGADDRNVHGRSIHLVFPMFTYGGGFLPDNSARLNALTERDALADSLVLRALIHYYYSGG